MQRLLRLSIFLIFVIIVTLSSNVSSDAAVPSYIPSFLKSGGGVKTARKGGYSSYRGSSKDLISAEHGVSYKKDCTEQPPLIPNALLQCSSYSGCRVKCMENYEFLNGETQLFLSCKNGEWVIDGTDWGTTPSCLPKCYPSCQNNGICISPNKCNCPDNYSGPHCQYENKPCLNFPQLPANSRRSCSPSVCTITCINGHQFPDGTAVANIFCKNGIWVPYKMASIPDCEATCTPPCQNGGNCLSFNVCQCPQEFRGPQCQYSVEACSAKKLKFNGAYNCSGMGDTFACSLTCPEGVKFDFPPVSTYTCDYATGLFSPSPIPQCKFDTDMEIISLGGSKQMFYKKTDHSPMSELLANVKGGKYGPGAGTYFDNMDVKGYNKATYGKSENQILEMKRPKPGSCFTWGGSHYKTFDGKVFSFGSKCSHTLLRDSVDSSFSVIVQNSEGCSKSSNCYRIIKLFLQDKEYVFKLTDEGVPMILSMSSKRKLPIPIQLPGMRVEMAAHYVLILVDVIGVTLKWDTQQLVQVEISESLWNRTVGLCGIHDGNIENDMLTKDGVKPHTVNTLATSWQVKGLDDYCDSVPTDKFSCTDKINSEARDFCKKLLLDYRFKACHKVMDVSVLLEACYWDYCTCLSTDRHECACQTMSVYIRECTHKGLKDLINWRDSKMCPMQCTGGRIYKACGPSITNTCGSPKRLNVENINGDPGKCEEGCYCPEGTLLHENHCVTEEQCPCRLRGKIFEPGTKIPKDCNTCTCIKGQWQCTQISCGARCGAVGDPHYVTFDGRRYDFMGSCSYYLIKTDNYTVEAENVPCTGAISEAMNFAANSVDIMPSCTKSTTIKIEGNIIKLKQNREITINGREITSLPYKIGGVRIRTASSIFVVVTLRNGLEIWWDGMTRVYLDAPADLKGQTQGLCGTFNYNQKDDFLTPEGDVETAIIPFANKWKTTERCNDLPNKDLSHPCEINMHRKMTAEQHCKKIKKELFASCLWFVDPEPFYQDCLYDMCSCELKISQCLCPIIAAYAKECAHQGVKIEWRNDVRECGIQCPTGQIYQICGDSCTHTCLDISSSVEHPCKTQCVEGCNCPPGKTLDENGECIPTGQCKCQHNGIEFEAGFKEIRPGKRSQDTCTCIGGLWDCKPATPEEILSFPKANSIKNMCSESNHEEFTSCEPVEPITCKNMHAPPEISNAVCKAGCQCQKGYVLDSFAKQCILPESCPCHHGGKSYTEKETIEEDCNTCTCSHGKWKCTDRVCNGQCVAWGDSHYKTFDGRLFDFQGSCDYVFVKGVLDPSESFDVTIQNVPCGSTGVTCSKSVTFVVGSGDNEEIITFTRDKQLPKISDLKHINVRTAGLFIIAEVPDIGVTLQWDQGTRVYVKVTPKWKGRLKGLCGNYDDNELNDFQTPSGGVSEVSALLFGDSWRLQPYCPESMEITNTCEFHPQRRLWATKKCGLLKTELFRPCHTEIPVEPFLERCIFDACACDQGGDCECLCTALAAYAHECNNKGVPIKWRSQRLCPIQCDKRCSVYSPCISTCPIETCDNSLILSKLSETCTDDSCVEGCLPKECPPGQIYFNSSTLECVPRTICKTVCMELEGVTYYEGDLIEMDDCHTCHCSHGSKVCKGKPCSSSEKMMPTTLVTPIRMHEQKTLCRSGWTSWVNSDSPQVENVKGKPKKQKLIDIEPLPTFLQLNNIPGSAVCSMHQMTDIRCRTVNKHIESKATGLDVECSLEKGLLCQSYLGERPCEDFEISVYCECENISKEVTTPYVYGAKTPGTAEIKDLDEELVLGPCELVVPYKKHPTDCHIFYQCSPGPKGPEYVEKTCGPDMMFNPVSQTCDWQENVIKIRGECEEGFRKKLRPIHLPEVSEISCPPGQKFSKCAISCDNVCLYYYYYLVESGLCNKGKTCIEGCVDKTAVHKCPPGSMWRDNSTCISLHDCSCVSYKGELVQPGTVFHESDCETCQCIDNYYTCDSSACAPGWTTPKHRFETFRPATDKIFYTTKKPPVIILPTTITPPALCLDENYKYLIEEDEMLADDAFSASSEYSSAFLSKYARLNNKITTDSGGSWVPAVTNTDQYLQIKLKKQEPLYGVIVQGGPLYDEYVTSYFVLHSEDGHVFSYVTDNSGNPKLFRGPVDKVIPVKQMFDVPFETKIIRFNPQTWHSGISMRVELIGCGEYETTIHVGTKKPEIPMISEKEDITIRRKTTVRPKITEFIKSITPKVPEISKEYPEVIPEYEGTPEEEVEWMKFISKTPIKTTTVLSVDEIYKFKPTTVKPKLSTMYKMSTKQTIMYVEPTTIKPICDEPMGLDEGEMSIQQISVSSEKPGFGKKYLRLGQPMAWEPLTNSPTEWILFDFLSPRKLTGIVTKGGPKGWVTSYKIQYSNDKINWNPVLDELLNEKVFLANFDRNWPKKVIFDRPIFAKYLKVIPLKWHDNIQIRLEIHGCFEPYPEIVETATVRAPTKIPSVSHIDCNICPDVEFGSFEEKCKCKKDKWWNGENCVNRAECSCVVGHLSYPVGTTYTADGCMQCICKLNGVPECKLKECHTCSEGLQRVLLPSCQCTCKPCPSEQILCPTSNICINETSWCDGVEDCSDDEINCYTTEPTIPTTIATKVITKKPCAVPSCPVGYKIIKKNLPQSKYLQETELSPMFQGGYKSYNSKGGRKVFGGTKGGVKGGYRSSYKPLPKPIKISEEIDCPQFKCVSTKPLPAFGKPKDYSCPPAKCPPDYKVFYETDDDYFELCPRYSCAPTPPPDSVCNITGRTFNTFDGVEYKYDICNHILARDMQNNEWEITIQKNCTITKMCSNDLLITQSSHEIRLHPDLSVEFDGYMYTVDQTKKIGLQTKSFLMSRVGDTLFYASKLHGFWLTWDKQGNIKIGVSGKLIGKVNGLCGYFNNKAEDDKQKSDSSLARTTVEFGDSWAHLDQPFICETKTCPIYAQKKALTICNAIKHKSLSICDEVMNTDRFVSQCLETACACLENGFDAEKCKCEILQRYVVECQAKDTSIDLAGWRIQHSCAVSCPPPLVHYDCYRRRCERSCDDLQVENPCPITPDVCFPGCYCPPGLVKKNNKCVPPVECRDCVCNSQNGQYKTYDKRNFTFNGNCSYIVSRDVVKGDHGFEVFVTNYPCRDNPLETCTEAITIKYKDNVIRVSRDEFSDKLVTEINRKLIRRYPVNSTWVQIEDFGNTDINILIPEIQLEVSTFHHNLAFLVQVPSQTYKDNTEGLCGNCNKNPKDDLKKSDGTLTEDVTDFVSSWLSDEPILGIQENCASTPKNECLPLPPDKDPCFNIMDDTKFGQCHLVIDPIPYLTSCQQDVCQKNKDVDVCAAIESYARDCVSAGLCPNWRTATFCSPECPPGLKYQPCNFGCKETCDNYEKLRKDPKSCSLKKIEGCFCPEGKVLHNNTCIESKYCKPCDKEGHYPGDIWQPNKCTECKCESKGIIQCEKRQCPAVGTVCEASFIPVPVTGDEDECCAKFLCVPEATVGPTCSEPLQPKCGKDQIMKLIKQVDGCSQFVCSCKPSEECESIEMATATPLEPGMERLINTSGCCPIVEDICQKDLCPKPPACQEHYEQIKSEIPGKCCPKYQCEPPKDKCLYNLEFMAAPLGGEQPRSKKQLIVKKPGATWQDGPCRECRCVGSGSYRAECRIAQCPTDREHPEFKDYVLKPVPIPGECCTKYKREDCKQDGKVYKIGDKWPPSNKDRCTTVTCVKSGDEVQKETIMSRCDTKCNLGSKYIPSPPDSSICCGTCQSISCVVGGKEYEVGKKWKSSDYCTEFVCLNLNGTLQVKNTVEFCPNLTREQKEKYIWKEETVPEKCCKKNIALGCQMNGKKYNIGEEWVSPINKCTKLKCEINDQNEVRLSETTEKCNEKCLKGWKYIASKDSSKCCGECIQSACVIDDKVYEENSKWASEDGCTQFSCDKQRTGFVITSSSEKCPSLEDCPESDIYNDGCCEKCNISIGALRKIKCQPKTLKPEATIGLIQMTHAVFGNCRNTKPLTGFTECIGQCDSSTFFNTILQDHESKCECCQATKFGVQPVQIICENGKTLTVTKRMPIECSCHACNSAPSGAYKTKGGRGVKTKQYTFTD